MTAKKSKVEEKTPRQYNPTAGVVRALTKALEWAEQEDCRIEEEEREKIAQLVADIEPRVKQFSEKEIRELTPEQLIQAIADGRVPGGARNAAKIFLSSSETSKREEKAPEKKHPKKKEESKPDPEEEEEEEEEEESDEDEEDDDFGDDFDDILDGAEEELVE